MLGKDVSPLVVSPLSMLQQPPRLAKQFQLGKRLSRPTNVRLFLNRHGRDSNGNQTNQLRSCVHLNIISEFCGLVLAKVIMNLASKSTLSYRMIARKTKASEARDNESANDNLASLSLHKPRVLTNLECFLEEELALWNSVCFSRDVCSRSL